MIRKTTIAILTSAALITSLSARDQVRIVGSSTVYPYASLVAEEFGAITDYQTPVVESTGSGGGLKLFCSGNGLKTPDITNASRRMKASEFEVCKQNGVVDITEAVIGYDGVAFANTKENKLINITKKQLALAVAAEVPNKDGKLVKNPYKKWSQIDASLPDQEIIIYGPPKSSGTRDAFEEMVLQATFKTMPEYTSLYEADKVKNKRYKKYSIVRQDGAYVASGENDNLIVQKLSKNKDAFGIFGYSFLIENSDVLQGATIDNISPNPETISSGKYPIARSMYFYIKNKNIQEVPAIVKYSELFMSEEMIGNDGILSDIGLISLPEDLRVKARDNVKNKVVLKLEDLKKSH